MAGSHRHNLDIGAIAHRIVDALDPDQQLAAAEMAGIPADDEATFAGFTYSLIDEALASGKTVALPKFVEATKSYVPFKISHVQRDCAAGRFGIIEPIATCQWVLGF